MTPRREADLKDDIDFDMWWVSVVLGVATLGTTTDHQIHGEKLILEAVL
jgi:hypothetical protein